MAKTPIYVSESTIKSLWQEYRIYDDHVEFHTHLGIMKIPFSQITGVSVSESEVKGMLRGNLHLKGFKPALKLDWANFTTHVVLDKNAGSIQRILFTPEDPQMFMNILEDKLVKV